MLVKTRGTDDMSIFINSEECKRFIENGIHVLLLGLMITYKQLV
jgi:hypothetical protein